MSFEQKLTEKTAYCEKILIDMLPSVEGLEGSDRYAATVVDAMQYSVMAGGKRLRPLFLNETCRMYGGREALAAPFMAALEMIHNYSLVHDDMPAMDNDEYRRGRKTTWVVYGDGMAILAGDALLNYAYETALKAFDQCENVQESACVVSAMKLLLGGNVVGIKVFVDTTLFFVSYKIQHKYIFKDDRKKEEAQVPVPEEETAGRQEQLLKEEVSADA